MTDRFELHGVDLAEQSRRVRALARGIAQDAHTADDLAQDALVLRVEQGGRGAGAVATEPLRWLGGVVRNLAHRRHRSESRRRHREEAAAREESTDRSTLDAVAHAEMLERVVKATLALDEPYRSTLLMRYLQELPTEEVARRQGVETATVRVRTKRGLEKLRNKMRRELGAGFAVMLLRFSDSVPLVSAGAGTAGSSIDPSGHEEVEMVRTSTEVGVSSGASASGPALTAVAASVALVGVVATTWWLAGSGPGGDAPLPGTDHGAATALRVGEGPANGVEVASRLTDPSRTEIAPDRPNGKPSAAASAPFEGFVFGPEGHPVSGAQVAVIDSDLGAFSLGARGRVWEATTDADGQFHIEDFRPDARGLLIVEASGFAQWRGRIENAPETTYVHLQGSTTLSGIVLDTETDAPLAGVAVYSPVLGIDRSAGRTADEGVVRWRPPVRTGADGRFQLGAVPTDESFALRLALPGTLPGAASVTLARDSSGEQTFRVSRLDREVHVREFDYVTQPRTERPIAGASVTGLGTQLDLGYTGPDGSLALPLTQIDGSVAGAKVLDELGVQARGFCDTSLVLLSNTHSDVTAQMVREARLEGVVLGTDGQPLVGAEVSWRELPSRGVGDGKGGGLMHAFARDLVARTGTDGRFVLDGVLPLYDGLPVGTFRSIKVDFRECSELRVEHPSGQCAVTDHRTQPLRPGETARIEVVATVRRTVSGLVTLADGSAPPVRTEVSASNGDIRRTTWTLDDGSWAFDELSEGEWVVRTELPGTNVHRARTLDVVGADVHGVAIALPTDLDDLLLLQGRAVDPSGRPWVGARVTRSSRTGEQSFTLETALEPTASAGAYATDLPNEFVQTASAVTGSGLEDVTFGQIDEESYEVVEDLIVEEPQVPARVARVSANAEANVARQTLVAAPPRIVQREGEVAAQLDLSIEAQRELPLVANVPLLGLGQSAEAQRGLPMVANVPLLGLGLVSESDTTQTDAAGRFTLVLPKAALDSEHLLEIEGPHGSGAALRQRITIDGSGPRDYEVARLVSFLIPVESDVPSGRIALTWRPTGGEERELPRGSVAKGHVDVELPVGSHGTLLFEEIDGDRRVELTVDLTGRRPLVSPATARL